MTSVSRSRWRLHARTRLTLWYTGLLAVTLLLVGGGTLVSVRTVLQTTLDDSLRARALAMEEAIEHELREGERGDQHELEVHAAGTDVLRAWNARGRLLIGRDEGRRLAPSAVAFPGIPERDTFTTERLAGGTQVRLLTHPIRAGASTVGVIQVGRSTADLERVLGQLWLLGAGGLLTSLALAGAGGIWLARRALAPIEEVTRAAQSIGAHDLSRRLSLDLPDDEIGRLARAFDGMTARLESAFARQQRFTADASHELRTPLGIIQSHVDVALAQPRATDSYVRTLQNVRTEASRLTALTEQLLTLARADGRDALTLVPVDIQDIVAEAGARWAARARSQGIRLEVTLGDVPDVRGDPIWLTQLLGNLLDNALRHTPAGGVVSLILESAAVRGAPFGLSEGIADSASALVRVRDTGEGIAPEHLPHLFERFYRADPGRERARGGAGLGLAIADWVARAHGGRLTVTSEPGVGTEVALWLPESSSPPSPPPVGAPAGPVEGAEVPTVARSTATATRQ